MEIKEINKIIQSDDKDEKAKSVKMYLYQLWRFSSRLRGICAETLSRF